MPTQHYAFKIQIELRSAKHEGFRWDLYSERIVELVAPALGGLDFAVPVHRIAREWAEASGYESRRIWVLQHRPVTENPFHFEESFTPQK